MGWPHFTPAQPVPPPSFPPLPPAPPSCLAAAYLADVIAVCDQVLATLPPGPALSSPPPPFAQWTARQKYEYIRAAAVADNQADRDYLPADSTFDSTHFTDINRHESAWKQLRITHAFLLQPWLDPGLDRTYLGIDHMGAAEQPRPSDPRDATARRGAGQLGRPSAARGDLGTSRSLDIVDMLIVLSQDAQKRKPDAQASALVGAIVQLLGRRRSERSGAAGPRSDDRDPPQELVAAHARLAGLGRDSRALREALERLGGRVPPA